MKKILHISNYYLPNFGGIEQVAYDIIDSLKGDYLQKVVCFSEDGRDKKYNFEEIEVESIGYLKKVASQAISFSYYFKLRKIIKEYQPDIIHFHLPNPLVTLYYLFIPMLKGKKLVLHWHSDIVKQKKILKFYLPLQNFILKRSNKIIVTSPNYRSSEYLSDFLDKVEVVPNIVDKSKFILTRENVENIDKVKKKYIGKKIVFFLGRHVEYKGIEYLIKASNYFSEETKVLIAGSGPLTQSLQEMAKGNPKIEFLGRISNNEVKEYLYASDIFAFPSITKNEAFGVALAEALCCGTPAVCFDIEGSGVSFVNQNQYTGYVVENKNHIKFSEAINELANNDELRNEFSKNSKEWIEKELSKEVLNSKIKKLYLKLIENK